MNPIITRKDLDKMGEEINKAFSGLVDRIKVLEAKVVELEEKPAKKTAKAA